MRNSRRTAGRSPRSGSRLVTRPPAKVNLTLEVLGRRSDGYHDIRSLMVRVGLYDRLTIETGVEGLTLLCPDANLPGDESNLAMAAALAFREETGGPDGLRITLHKGIPTAAGLGGGSSDAASVLKGLNGLMGNPLSRDRLMELGLRLGSDVPFFIAGVPAVAEGRGEKLTPARDLPPMWYVLVNPGFGVSAAWAYRNLKLTGSSFGSKIQCLDGILSGARIELHNDLEGVVARSHPEVLEIKEFLMAQGAEGALMSGSGPTVFGVFRGALEAALAYIKISESLKAGVYLVQGLV